MTQEHRGVHLVSIDHDQAGQRLDNFLMGRLKGVPRSHVYRLLRSGQVRVNKGRKKPHYRLQAGDEVRVPPVSLKQSETPNVPHPLIDRLEQSILLENDDVLIIDKPAGLPVHAGSGVRYGVIEALRQGRPSESLELVHRLDRDTSGCLLLARSRQALTQCHEAFRNEHRIGKHYTALVRGDWSGCHTVDAALEKVVRSGEHMIQVSTGGQHALSHFECSKRYEDPVDASLMRIRIETGRTHQIRVHAAHHQHPLAGDSKYGDRDFDNQLRPLGLDRLFLHASKLEFDLPGLGSISAEAPLPDELSQLLEQLS